MTRRVRPSFSNLVSQYPKTTDPCDQGRDNNWNQCAIRTSIALIGAGFHLTGYNMGPLCSHGHARGAQSLGDYLWRQWGRPSIKTDPADARMMTQHKTGIVVFKDIKGFRNGIGDHIDLWNVNATMTGEYYDRADETWFWEIR